MVVAFDTLAASKQLQEAGLPEPQADAIVTTLSRGFGDNVATKHDLETAVARLEGKINELRGEMNRQTAWTLGTLLGAITVATAIIVAAG
ncbi:MAG: hypothetical protein F4X76_09810 [Chloroflexi bacterium]|nr:hypothetical protein [Chloroflexota bacterium]